MPFDIPTRALIVALKAPIGGARSSNDIAAATGIPVRTVNNIYVRAIRRGFVPHRLPLVLREEFLEDAPRSGRPRTRARKEGGGGEEAVPVPVPPGHGVKQARAKKFGAKTKKTLPRDQQKQQQTTTAVDTTSAGVSAGTTDAAVSADPVDDDAMPATANNAAAVHTCSVSPSIPPSVNTAPVHAAPVDVAPIKPLPINFVVDQIHQEGISRAHYSHSYHQHHSHQDGAMDRSVTAREYERQRYV